MASLVESIQSGVVTLDSDSTTTDVTISAVTLARAWVICTIRTTSEDPAGMCLSYSLSSTTNLTMRVNDWTLAGNVVEWQVIEFTAASGIAVQRGTWTTETSVTISAVTIADSHADGNFHRVGSTFGGDDWLRLDITGTTTLTTGDNIAGSKDYQVVDWNGHASVQHLDISQLTTDTTTKNVTISALSDYTKTAVIGSAEHATNVTGADFSYLQCSSNTNLQLVRLGGTLAFTISAQVIEFTEDYVTAQRSQTGIGTGATTNTATITSVDTSRSLIIPSSSEYWFASADNATDNGGDFCVTFDLTNSTTVTIAKADTGQTTATAFTVIEFAAPYVTNVTSDKANGTYSSGEEIFIQVCFDRAVSVSGIPQVILDVIAGGRTIDYVEQWSPAVLDAEGWYDASDLDTITDSAGSVSQWDDKSPNGLDVTQGTGSLQPTTETTTINDLNTILFAQDWLTSASNPFGATVTDAAVFMVLKTPSSLANGTSFSLTGSATAANRWQSHTPWGSGTGYFDNGGTGVGNRLQVSSWLGASEETMVSFYATNTDGAQEMWKNGSLSASNASGTAVTTVGNIFIGTDSGSTMQNMELGEMIIINGTVSTALRQQIEGYLAWKWGQVGNLPGGHPYENRPPLLWDPGSLSTLEGWYDAADEQTITGATNVSQWDDKSGNDRHAKQATEANQPSNGSTVGGLNAIDFVAANSDLLITDDVATWLTGTEYTIFAVSSQEVAGAGMICGINQSANQKGLHVGWKDASTWSDAHYNDDGDMTVTQNTDVVLTCSQYQAPGSELWRNGTSVGTNATLPANDLTTPTGGFNIGGGHSGSNPMDGKYCELVVITGAMTEANRQKVEGYLAWKWGLQANLPSTHPYVQFAPVA